MPTLQTTPPTQVTPQADKTAADLWYSRCGGATASTVAIQRQFLQQEFEQGGLRVGSIRDSADRNIRDSHYNHHLKAMFREGGNIPPIWARASGQDTAVLGITWVDEFQAILVRQGSGIRTIADLKGKRLGLPQHIGSLIDFQRGMAHRGFVVALKLAGLTANDAQFIDLPADDLEFGRRVNQERRRTSRPLQALLNNEVDAIYTKGTFIGPAEIKQHELHVVIDLNTYSDPAVRVNNGTPRPITVGREFLKEKPELVVRYLAVLLRTAKWAESHAREVRQAIAAESHVDEGAISFAYGNDLHLRLTPKLSDEYIAGLEIEKNFLRDHNFLPKDFEIQEWIVREPLAVAQRLVHAEPGFAQNEIPVLA